VAVALEHPGLPDLLQALSIRRWRQIGQGLAHLQHKLPGRQYVDGRMPRLEVSHVNRDQIGAFLAQGGNQDRQILGVCCPPVWIEIPGLGVGDYLQAAAHQQQYAVERKHQAGASIRGRCQLRSRPMGLERLAQVARVVGCKV
jgi:hypothetical protein